MASDKGTTLAEIRLRLFGVWEGKSGGKLQIESLCSPLLLCVCHFEFACGWKKKKLHINMSRGIIDDVRF